MLNLFKDLDPVLQALLATGFTWGVTALGASVVFLTRTVNRKLLDGMMGFAAGVMLAASFWSLLAPAIELAESNGAPPWLPAVVGFSAGGAFLAAADRLLPHLHFGAPMTAAEGIKTHWQRSRLLILAITLHNFPEGLAVGVAFGAVAAGLPAATLSGAIALAIGIGNAHGYYKGEPDIHLEVLEAVRKFTDIPLVLHGCTGMKEEIVKEAIKLGVAKSLARSMGASYYSLKQLSQEQILHIVKKKLDKMIITGLCIIYINIREMLHIKKMMLLIASLN